MKVFIEFFKKINFFKKTNIIAGLLILFIPLWLFVITPNILRIPADFSYQADVISVDNFYDSAINGFKGEQYSKTIFNYDVVSRHGSNLVIKNTFLVQTLNGKLIFKAEPLYGINAKTGQHVKGLGDFDREGYLFAPRNLNKKDSFIYWHADSNLPGVMKFVSEENLYGLKVYKYETDYGGIIDQTSALSFLPEVGKTLGVKLQTKNNIWIEPVSGYMVKQEDFATDYYFYDLKTGERLNPYNQFLNKFSEDSVAKHVALAKNNKYLALTVQCYFPLFLFVLAVCLFFWSFPQLSGVRDFLIKNIIGLVIFIIILIGTVAVSFFASNSLKTNNQTFLNSEIQNITNSIEERLNIYFSVLMGGRALFNVADNVSREDWKLYVDSLKIQDVYPGIQGLGYAKVVSPKNKQSLINSIRAEGFANFSIWPDSNQSILTSIIYLEPFDVMNQRAFGYDMYSSDPVRRQAMFKAAESGNVSISGKVTLLQEAGETNQQFGFLVYIPVYRKGANLDTAQSRLDNIEGFVYGVFRVNDFMSAIMKTELTYLDFRVYDGLKTNLDSLVFEHISNPQSQDNFKNQFFKDFKVIYIADHPWTIEYADSQNFKMGISDRFLPIFILLGGLLTSFLVFGLVYYISQSKSSLIKHNAELASAKEAAVEYAKELTRDLKKSQKELIEKNKNIQEKLALLDRTNKLMVGRELRMVELKRDLSKLKSSEKSSEEIQ